MTRTVAIAISLMTPAAFVWLAFGFMAWQWDPAHWDPVGRGMGVLVWASVSFALASTIVPAKKRRRL